MMHAASTVTVLYLGTCVDSKFFYVFSTSNTLHDKSF